LAEHQPEIGSLVKELDQKIITKGALDIKTKRLIAIGCVAVRMCEDCVYAQGLAAKNAGATKQEIIEALKVAVLTGGIPITSVAKSGVTKLFEEWED